MNLVANWDLSQFAGNAPARGGQSLRVVYSGGTSVVRTRTLQEGPPDSSFT